MYMRERMPTGDPTMHSPGAIQTLADPGLSDLTTSDFFEGSPIATLVINADHVVTHFNRACSMLLGVEASEVIGKAGLGRLFYEVERPVMADLIVDGAMDNILADFYQNGYRRSLAIPDAYEAEGFFPRLGSNGRWLFFTAAPLKNASGEVVGAVETLQDITERKVAENALMTAQIEVEGIVMQRTSQLAELNTVLKGDVERRELAERELLKRNAELNMLNDKLSMAQEHLVQQEKLASIGQLAAGVAHEINNPIGYIFSNFGMLEKYLVSLFDMLSLYEQAEKACSDAGLARRLQQKREELEVDFLKEDIPELMKESKEGIVRVRKIVQDLKDFSHVESTPEWQWSNLHQGIDSTLNVVNNEIKYKADIVKQYGDIPEVQCMLSQINQVVMNLVVNAAHAMGEERGKIYIRTGCDADLVWLEVEDTGGGIPKDVVPRIFDPFYTTKPVGKGTGLGLSLSYGIVQKHHGHIEVHTEVGHGTTFRVTLPLRQDGAAAASLLRGASHD
jgi:two-component system NtrC family sensor kinase